MLFDSSIEMMNQKYKLSYRSTIFNKKTLTDPVTSANSRYNQLRADHHQN